MFSEGSADSALAAATPVIEERQGHGAGRLAASAPIVGAVGFGVCVGLGLINQLGYQFADEPNVFGGWIALILTGLVLLAGGLLAVFGRVGRWPVAMAIGIFGLTISPIVSAQAHGDPLMLRGLTLSLAFTGATLCAGASPPRAIRVMSFWVFAAIVWISLAAAAGNLVFGGSTAFRSHFGPRHAEYLGVPVLSGITSHQNTMGFICAIGLTVQWAITKSTKAKSGSGLTWPSRTVLIAVGPAATAVALVWTQSKTALAAAIVGVVLVSLPLGRLKGGWWAAAWGAALVAITALPLAVGFAGITTFTGRAELWQYALDDFRANPMFGYGPDFMARDSYWAGKPTFPDLFGAHNQLMEMLGRTGLFGAGWLLAFALIVAVVAWRARAFDSGVGVGAVIVIVLTATQETIILLSTNKVVGLRDTYIPMLLALGLLAASASLTPRDRVSTRPNP